jgi:hypothetical protein
MRYNGFMSDVNDIYMVIRETYCDCGRTDLMTVSCHKTKAGADAKIDELRKRLRGIWGSSAPHLIIMRLLI